MERGLVVYRRDLPGGRIVMISIDERDPATVVARLQVERRSDPERRRVGQPPVIAEIRAPTRAAALEMLRTLAENDAEIASRLEARAREPRPTDAPSSGATMTEPRRVLMADGGWWGVERRHGMTQLARAGGEQARPLYLFFHGLAGALRRAEVDDAFPEEASEDDLRSAWARAVILQ